MTASSPFSWKAERHKMVRRQLVDRGLTDRRVLAAMAGVPRDHFVPEHLLDRAYDDTPLPVGHGQTISQPYIVALMTIEAGLTRQSVVLEVGTGTGYHTAVLARIARHIVSVERLATLSAGAAGRLSRIGIRNVDCVVGDGAVGSTPSAPYDAVIVTAAAPGPPRALLEQVKVGGRLVIPIGSRDIQELTVFERLARGYDRRGAGACRFVPLVSPASFDQG